MMIFTSPDFTSGGLIPLKYTIHGENVNPNFIISRIPKTAKSLVIIMDDPDGPNGNFIHWIMWNIDPTITEITSGTKPKNAIVGQNSQGTNKYIGPFPEVGTHRYHFKIYALDTILDLPPTSTAKQLIPLIDRHRLDYGQMLGIYQKSMV